MDLSSLSREITIHIFKLVLKQKLPIAIDDETRAEVANTSRNIVGAVDALVELEGASGSRDSLARLAYFESNAFVVSLTVDNVTPTWCVVNMALRVERSIGTTNLHKLRSLSIARTSSDTRYVWQRQMDDRFISETM